VVGIYWRSTAFKDWLISATGPRPTVKSLNLVPGCCPLFTVNMEEQTKGEKNPDASGTKIKQRRRNSGSYEKDMNKFLTIIYHNINRLHEDKTTITKSCSEPHQLQLCGTQEPPFMESSVSGIHRSGRRHSDFGPRLSQLERSNSSNKDFKRKVAFADTLTEESNFPF